MKSSKVKGKLHDIISECAQKHGTTAEDVYADKPVEDPCFYRCSFQGYGLMNENGVLNLDKLLTIVEDTQPEEEEEYKNCTGEEDPCMVAKCVADVNDKYNEE